MMSRLPSSSLAGLQTAQVSSHRERQRSAASSASPSSAAAGAAEVQVIMTPPSAARRTPLSPTSNTQRDGTTLQQRQQQPAPKVIKSEISSGDRSVSHASYVHHARALRSLATADCQNPHDSFFRVPGTQGYFDAPQHAAQHSMRAELRAMIALVARHLDRFGVEGGCSLSAASVVTPSPHDPLAGDGVISHHGAMLRLLLSQVDIGGRRGRSAGPQANGNEGRGDEDGDNDDVDAKRAPDAEEDDDETDLTESEKALYVILKSSPMVAATATRSGGEGDIEKGRTVLSAPSALENVAAEKRNSAAPTPLHLFTAVEPRCPSNGAVVALVESYRHAAVTTSSSSSSHFPNNSLIAGLPKSQTTSALSFTTLSRWSVAIDPIVNAAMPRATTTTRTAAADHSSSAGPTLWKSCGSGRGEEACGGGVYRTSDSGDIRATFACSGRRTENGVSRGVSVASPSSSVVVAPSSVQFVNTSILPGVYGSKSRTLLTDGHQTQNKIDNVRSPSSPARASNLRKRHRSHSFGATVSGSAFSSSKNNDNDDTSDDNRSGRFLSLTVADHHTDGVNGVFAGECVDPRAGHWGSFGRRVEVEAGGISGQEKEGRKEEGERERYYYDGYTVYDAMAGVLPDVREAPRQGGGTDENDERDAFQTEAARRNRSDNTRDVMPLPPFSFFENQFSGARRGEQQEQSTVSCAISREALTLLHIALHYVAVGVADPFGIVVRRPIVLRASTLYTTRAGPSAQYSSSLSSTRRAAVGALHPSSSSDQFGGGVGATTATTTVVTTHHTLALADDLMVLSHTPRLKISGTKVPVKNMLVPLQELCTVGNLCHRLQAVAAAGLGLMTAINKKNSGRTGSSSSGTRAPSPAAATANVPLTTAAAAIGSVGIAALAALRHALRSHTATVRGRQEHHAHLHTITPATYLRSARAIASDSEIFAILSDIYAVSLEDSWQPMQSVCHCSTATFLSTLHRYAVGNYSQTVKASRVATTVLRFVMGPLTKVIAQWVFKGQLVDS